ncbi:MAG: type II toxin-antitoxin system HigB family toxin [Gemmatimonadaceae bacterium]
MRDRRGIGEPVLDECANGGIAIRHDPAEYPEHIPKARTRLGGSACDRTRCSDFAGASFVGGETTVFNVAGNKYRLVANIVYSNGRVYVDGVYTHEEYDRLAEQRGTKTPELAALPGGRSRLSEFMHGKRSLSITQVRSLRDELGIPADLLIE